MKLETSKELADLYATKYAAKKYGNRFYSDQEAALMAMTDSPMQTELTMERLITLAEAARRSGHEKKTLYNWISLGKLGGQQGLYYVGRRPMIDWAAFESAFVRKAT